MLLYTLLLLSVLFQSNSHDPQTIIDKSIKAHGGKKYWKNSYQFEFRDRTYTYFNKEGAFSYTRTSKSDEAPYLDMLTNDGFKRWQDGEEITLSAKQRGSYSESVNSVIYFAILPYFLNDPAVNKEYIGEKEINGKDYYKIRVTFEQEGGGKDYDDVYIYWFDQEDYSLDYLAYSFHVNGGGVRFRRAYNTRNVEGVVFQDYVNYKHDKSTPVDQLDDYLINGTLKELSRIELKNIRSL